MDFSRLPLTDEAVVKAEYLDHLKHMNVMWYTHHFDRATWSLYERFDFGVEYHTQSGMGSFALEQHTRYLAELREGESFKIYTRMLARNEKLFHYIHFMVRERDGELSATSELLGIHIDLSARRSSPMPARIQQALDELIAEHSQLDWDAPLSGSITL